MEFVIGKYEKLLAVKVLHPWFKDGVCDYLTIEPDAPTKKLLRQMHLISKNYDGEINIITEINETKENNKVVQTPVSSFTKNQHLVFLLRLTNTRFFEITKLDITGFPKQVLYFSNNTKTAKLTFEKCTVTDNLIKINFDKGKVPVKEKIIAADKREVFQTDIDKNAAEFNYRFFDNETGLYTAVSEFAKSDKVQTQTFYYDPFIRKNPVIGIIDIDASAIKTINDDKNTFIIQFEKN